MIIILGIHDAFSLRQYLGLISEVKWFSLYSGLKQELLSVFDLIIDCRISIREIGRFIVVLGIGLRDSEKYRSTRDLF